MKELKELVRKRKERMEKEAEEHQKALAERSARVEAAQDSRVIRLDAWLVQQKGFAFANCTALRQWLAHEPDGQRMQGDYANDLKSFLGTGNNEIVQDYFMPKLTPSLSEKRLKERLILLDSIIHLADTAGKVLSNSWCAKKRLFAHFGYYLKEDVGAAAIIQALNLDDDRVATLDLWLKTEARLSFFKDADDVKMWMDDFGEASKDIYSVSEMNSNKIVGDFFQNLPKQDIKYLSHGGPKTGYRRKGFSQTGSMMTLETVKRNLSKVMPFPFFVHLLLPHNAIICNDMDQDSEGKHCDYQILLGVHAHG